jgi:hypothetical protein
MIPGCPAAQAADKAAMRHALASAAVLAALAAAGCSSPERNPPPSHETSRDSHQRTAGEQDKAFKELDAEVKK